MIHLTQENSRGVASLGLVAEGFASFQGMGDAVLGLRPPQRGGRTRDATSGSCVPVSDMPTLRPLGPTGFWTQ